MSFDWLNSIKDNVVSKATDVGKMINKAAANRRRRQSDEYDQEGSDYYDEEDDEEQKETSPGKMIKSKIELRLIIKQARINANEDDPNQTVRVEFTRNGKSLSTSDKPVNEQTGEGDIKQSFN